MENKNLAVGILAHVDAGKTTLAEGILYTLGNIRNLGRVDHKDAFLDTYALERARGITIFSKQARICLGDKNITLLDTPGHVDFSAEMERTLGVLDYAILVISGADGIQGHVLTLWKLLKKYEIPAFIFINKMDQAGTDKALLLTEIQSKLDEHCLDFTKDEASLFDELAMCSEALMDEYLKTGELSVENIALAIASREVYPCMFGSALKLEGIDKFLKLIEDFSIVPDYPGEFGARVFKIARDNSGNRLTYLKVTGGLLKAKMLVNNHESAGMSTGEWEEKVDQIRLYDGAKYTTGDIVSPGGICAVTGLTKTFAGEGLGYEDINSAAYLEPVLTYQVILPQDCDPVVAMGKLRQLEEEDPQLHLLWNEEKAEIHVKVMGEIQIEILKSLILEKFGLEVSFDSGSIVYKETIATPVIGIGHFEPLRHYAEVHVVMEPAKPGEGLQFATACSEDMLDKNWQRLIMTHFEEKIHPGVLTGSQITDMRIVLVAGRAHKKHTEGGDFRQATYRAIRNGLKKASSVLLEPYFEFRLELPTQYLGRAMTDVKRMCGDFEAPITEGENSILTGTAPVATMRNYQSEVNSYTRGLGKFSCSVKGYAPCHNAEEVIGQIGYDSEADINNPTGSVFCAHGAGFIVDWDRVWEYAHIDISKQGINIEQSLDESEAVSLSGHDGKEVKSFTSKTPKRQSVSDYISQEEIDEIFNKTFGRRKEQSDRYRRFHKTNRRTVTAEGSLSNVKPYKGMDRPKEEYLLVDGYNIIFAWEELRLLASRNIDSARDSLIDIMCNYQGYLGHTLILVYDAYKVKGNPGSIQKINNIYVVYTKEAETADQYIEKTVHEIGKKYRVTVATSDGLEQMIIWGEGATRMSALGLKEAVEAAGADLRDRYGIEEV